MGRHSKSQPAPMQEGPLSPAHPDSQPVSPDEPVAVESMQPEDEVDLGTDRVTGGRAF